MKPPAFKYIRVQTVDESLAALKQYGEEGKILAGGQSLVPMLNFRLTEPTVLVDINPVTELDYIRFDNGRVRIGARTRQRALEKNSELREKYPLVAEAALWIGHPQIRNRGTVGGSLVHGDPTAELALMAVLLEAQITIRKVGETRTVGPNDFFVGVMTTGIGVDEMVTEVTFAQSPAHSGYGFRELCLRHGDFAVVAAAVQLTTDSKGRIEEARVGVSGVGDMPLRVRPAEEALVGAEFKGEVLDAAAALVPDELQAFPDLKGSEAYRKEMARVFVRRALEDASKRLKESQVK